MIPRAKTAIASLLALLSLGLVGAGGASAEITIESFSTTSSTPQAGGHPDLSTSFRLKAPGKPESVRNIEFNAPEGVFGNINAITACTQADFAMTSCPPNAQAGLITIHANHGGNDNAPLGTAPIYHVETLDPEVTALFGINVPTINVPILIPISVRTASDYGLRFKVAEITQLAPLAAADLTIWGLPGEESHDADRFPKGAPGEPSDCPGELTAGCNPVPIETSEPVRPLISNPSICTPNPLPTKIVVQSYQDPNALSEKASTYPAVTGCEKVTFDPVLLATPTTKEADAPSGLDLLLQTAQPQNFSVTPSTIRRTTVTLPDGFTINPDAADGQSSCTDAQARFGTDLAGQCPDNAKIGTFEIGSPALKGPLVGSLYIGTPEPGNQYRVLMIADGFGIHAKLVASVIPDSQTGRVRIVTQDLPQVPFETFTLHLFASDRGLMATPTHCSGAYEILGNFVPWNGKIAEQTASQIFGIESGPGGRPCPAQTRPFAPRLSAGASNPVAGQFSSFHLKLDRDDGDQFLGDLNFRMPPGFTGDLRGISYCPEPSIAAAAVGQGTAEALAPSCPASSRIGTSNVAAGPGALPFHAVGKMYLAGPLNGAPLSLVAITPALAGPYDYGNVVVRVALHIDPQTAQVSAVSDRMPQIIGGIPIRMRSIKVNIDRPDFTINPTNCSNFTVDSQGIGDQGSIADFSSPFTAVNCATLPFRPKMTIRKVGKGKSRRGQNPKLSFKLRTRKGDANIRSVSVTLPKAFEIDQSHLGNICSERELAEKQCAGRNPIGSATAATPLLDQPLSGSAYAVSGSGGLPRLAFILNGQVTIVPRADTRTVKGKLKTTVPVVPDAPIGRFTLNLLGGKRGYLINTRDICKSPPKIKVDYVAQNGKKLRQNVKVAGCKSAKRR